MSDEIALFAASNVTRPRWSLFALSNERVNVAGYFVVEEERSSTRAHGRRWAFGKMPGVGWFDRTIGGDGP